MAEDANQSAVPGTLGYVKFPITASLMLFAAVVLATWLFYAFPSQKDTFKFGIEAATLAAGVLSAYYVGQSLLQGVQQRDRSSRDAKVAAGCRFIERWNDPAMAVMKDVFREIINSGKAHDATYVDDELKETQKRIVVVEVLNLFE
jgi:hypothetical protein